MKTILNKKTSSCFILLFSLTIRVSIAQSEEIVIVDNDFPNRGGLVASFPTNVTLIEINSANSLNQILVEALAQDPDVKSIHLFVPTTDSLINLGGQSYTSDSILQQLNPDDFQANNNITLWVYSCSLAKNNSGIALLENIAYRTHFNVASCSTCDNLNEEFTFDYSVRPLTVTSTLFE